MFPNFTQVKEVYKGVNILRIVANIYSPKNYDDTDDNSWRYEPMSDHSSDKNIEYIGSVEAVVQDVMDSNGKQIYKLLEYKVESVQ